MTFPHKSFWVPLVTDGGDKMVMQYYLSRLDNRRIVLPRQHGPCTPFIQMTTNEDFVSHAFFDCNVSPASVFAMNLTFSKE